MLLTLALSFGMAMNALPGSATILRYPARIDMYFNDASGESHCATTTGMFMSYTIELTQLILTMHCLVAVAHWSEYLESRGFTVM